MSEGPEVRLARAISEALLVYAEEKAQQQHALTVEPEALIEDAELPVPRGPRQKDVAESLIAAPSEGWKTGEIAQLVRMDQPNAYLTLQALQKQEIVELVPGSDPQRWRLRQRYRQRHQIMRVAGLVNQGEFTTYGDISHVVYGHSRGAKGVGRIASTIPEFPTPHRFLGKGGAIPPVWGYPGGTGSPDEAEQLLRDEGVEVLHDDSRRYAHPRHYVSHEELSARLRQQTSHT